MNDRYLVSTTRCSNAVDQTHTRARTHAHAKPKQAVQSRCSHCTAAKGLIGGVGGCVLAAGAGLAVVGVASTAVPTPAESVLPSAPAPAPLPTPPPAAAPSRCPLPPSQGLVCSLGDAKGLCQLSRGLRTAATSSAAAPLAAAAVGPALGASKLSAAPRFPPPAAAEGEAAALLLLVLRLVALLPCGGVSARLPSATPLAAAALASGDREAPVISASAADGGTAAAAAGNAAAVNGDRRDVLAGRWLPGGMGALPAVGAAPAAPWVRFAAASRSIA